MAKLYKEIFSDFIRKQINQGYFKNKQELIQFLNDFNTNYFNNPELMQALKQAGINLKELDVNAVIPELLNYYDKGKTDDIGLNMDGVTQMVIDDKNYIKAEVNGSTVVLDNNVTKDSLAEQIKDIQNASNGQKNMDQIIETMRRDKIEANLVSPNKINTRKLSEEERKEFAAVMNVADADEINFLVDPERNIYINKDTGETFYARKNSEGNMEVRMAEEASVNAIEQEPNSVPELGDIITDEAPDFDLHNLEALNNDELEHLINDDSLTIEQKTAVADLLEKRNETTISSPVEETTNNNEQNPVSDPTEIIEIPDLELENVEPSIEQNNNEETLAEEVTNNNEQNQVSDPTEIIETPESELNNVEDLKEPTVEQANEEILVEEATNNNEQNPVSDPTEIIETPESELNNVEDLKEPTVEQANEEALVEEATNNNEQNQVSDPTEIIETPESEINNVEDLREPSIEPANEEVLVEEVTNNNEQNFDHVSNKESKFKNFSDSDLQYIVDTNRLSSLSTEDQATVLNLLERRNERTTNTLNSEKTNNEPEIEQEQTSIEHQKVKTLQLLNKPYNGFTSILYLSLTTLSVGICFVLYLMIKIYL